MGQKTNPISNRLGITRTWDSIWYGGKNYSEKLAEDIKIRNYLNSRLEKAQLSRIIIERTIKFISITIYAARPGMIIGAKGSEADKLKEELKRLTNKDIQIYIHEVKRPELDATIIAKNIAKQIEGRVTYRRAIKTAIANAIRAGAEGIKVSISGRIGGAEMARKEEFKEGQIPLHTFRADIDYALGEAQTVYGKLGIKVWVCRGMMYHKPDFYGLETTNNKRNNPTNRSRRSPRRKK
jgi:small subunit ribosomal protein S3